MATLRTSSGYTIKFAKEYTLTRLAGVDFPDSRDGFMFNNPSFILSCEENGIPMDTLRDLGCFLNSFRPNIVRSKYYDSIWDNISYYFDIDEDLEGQSAVFKLRDGFNPDQKLLNVLPQSTSNQGGILFAPSPLPSGGECQFHGRYRSVYHYELDGLLPQLQQVVCLVCSPSEVLSNRSTINRWDYRPIFSFFKKDLERHQLYFGMEVELCTSLSASDLLRLATEESPKQEPFFYFKSDSSISGRHENTFELVTHPMTPARMKDEFEILLKKLENRLLYLGKTIDDVVDNSDHTSNGIHIHVSRCAFQDKSSLKYHLNRFVAALNQWDTSNLNFFKGISRRPQSNNGYYYKPHPAMVGRTLARRLRNGVQEINDRRTACHTTTETVEVRIFHSILSEEHIKSCIDFTEAMFNFSGQASLSSYGLRFSKEFPKWVFSQRGYPSLKRTLNSLKVPHGVARPTSFHSDPEF